MKRRGSLGRIETEITSAGCASGDSRIHVSANAGTAVIGKRLQRGQHGIAHGFDVDVARVQVDAGFHQFGAVLQSVIDQILNGRDRLLLRHLHGGSRDDVGLGQHRIFNAAAERVLHQQLLQLQIVLRHDEVLLTGGHCALRAHHLNGRHGADLCLALCVFERFLRVSERLLLHADVFVGIDQIPIHVLDLVDGGDDLQAKSDIGDFAIVFRDANESRVGKKAETLQQILGDSEIESSSLAEA